VKGASPGNESWKISNRPNNRNKIYDLDVPYQAYIMQVEMYATMFDFLAKIHNMDLRIAYTAILYYYTESVGVGDKGFAKIIKIKRNPKLILMDEDQKRSIIHNLKQV